VLILPHRPTMGWTQSALSSLSILFCFYLHTLLFDTSVLNLCMLYLLLQDEWSIILFFGHVDCISEMHGVFCCLSMFLRQLYAGEFVECVGLWIWMQRSIAFALLWFFVRQSLDRHIQDYCFQFRICVLQGKIGWLLFLVLLNSQDGLSPSGNGLD
jgi:hypothetical protein